MKIILLSGGSGKRLWPLSNDTRSKQFLKLLTNPCGMHESMIQRVVRQISAAGLTNDITIATGSAQKDAILLQLGEHINIVTEPCRRDTFPAIMLACASLIMRGTSLEEPVIVMPCDSFAEDRYFTTISRMAKAAEEEAANIILMGIEPSYPSSKFGYIVPDSEMKNKSLMLVKRFTEKPDLTTAEGLIKEGALWNGGVFAFRLGYLNSIINDYIPETIRSKHDTFKYLMDNYATLPKISFDYAVVEKTSSVAVIPYAGAWKDLGTWNTLTDELQSSEFGNIYTDECENTHVINELEIPVVVIGSKDMVVAASPDGILVSTKQMSENIKSIVDNLGKRPMYEERSWGEYKVIDTVEFPDGTCSLTKRITMLPGKSINCQRHSKNDKVWTFISGEGEILIDGNKKFIRVGDSVHISKKQIHALRAKTKLIYIEVQTGSNLEENDVEFLECEW